MAGSNQEERSPARYADAQVPVGPGGETHQVADGQAPVLTTQQGIPVADEDRYMPRQAFIHAAE